MRSAAITRFIAPLSRRLATTPHAIQTSPCHVAGETVSRARLLKAVGLAAVLTLSACDSDLESDAASGDDLPDSAGDSAEGLTLSVGSGAVQLIEGDEDNTLIPVSLTREAGATTTIVLDAVLDDARLEPWTNLAFSDERLDANELSSELSLQLAIGPRPIQPGTHTLTVTGSDEQGNELLSATLELGVTPTDRPDVYLLAGQSNMMGFSEDDSKQAGPGQPDEPVARIRQLNVTGNDNQNFATPADFVDPAKNFNQGLPLTIAVDPLHDGFDTTIDGKEGQRIGPGLSFAKRALADTTADIYLVPTAWSDTGFCKQGNGTLIGKGWNATAKSNEALAGTLLYDRAILRSNIALAETGGILRGILWHQGERDSTEMACAEVYAENLVELAAALRSNIDADARGSVARGPDADIPFIVGTMSQGADLNSDQLPFSDAKQIVDGVHRGVASLIPLSDFVETSDLVPPDYACGEGSCVHFGAAAYREMGNRYYETLIGLLP